MHGESHRGGWQILLALILLIASVFFFGWFMTLQPADSAPTFKPQKPVFQN